MNLKKRIIESDFFLTAKGKWYDTFELHAGGAGLLGGLSYYVLPEDLMLISYGLHFLLLASAFGLEWLRVDSFETKMGAKAKDAMFDFRDQIEKEGQYTVMFLIGFHACVFVATTYLIPLL